MELQHNTQRDLRAAVYQYVIQANGGSVTLEISKDDGGSWQNMTNGTFAADEDGIIYLSDCSVRPQITGSARIWVDRVLRGPKPNE